MHSLFISIFLLSCVLILPVNIYGTQLSSEENEKTLRIASTKQQYSLNFVEEYNHMELIIHSSIYSGLLTSNPNTLQPEVGLAVSWFINDTKDTFTFNLRKDAVFSDGSPVRAQDVKDSWIASIKSHNAFTYLFELIKGVSEYTQNGESIDNIQIIIINDQVLKVVLKEPAPYFLSTITHPAFSVSSSKQMQKENWGDDPTDIICSGPFVVSSQTDKSLILKKNENFWDKDSIFFEQVELLFYNKDEESQVLQEINDGRIHWSTFYGESQDADDENSTELEDNDWIIVHPIFGSEYLFFSDTQKEPWNNTRVRNAIKSLLPLEDIKKDYRFAANSLVPPISGVYEPSIIENKQDIALALDILEEEGYPQGKGLGTITLLATEFQDGTYRELFDKIVEALNTHLIDNPAVIKSIPVHTYQDELKQADFTIGLIQWIGDFADPAAFLQIWASPNPSLGHNYNDNEYQEIISKSNLQEGPERISTLIDTESMLLDNAVVIPLRRLVTINVVRTDLIKGWSSNILDLHLIGAMYLQDPYIIPRLSYSSNTD